jgi:hypothetical protein
MYKFGQSPREVNPCEMLVLDYGRLKSGQPCHSGSRKSGPTPGGLGMVAVPRGKRPLNWLPMHFYLGCGKRPEDHQPLSELHSFVGIEPHESRIQAYQTATNTAYFVADGA